MLLCLFGNKSKMRSKYGKNKQWYTVVVVHKVQLSVSQRMFLPHNEVFWDLLLNRPTETRITFGK